MFQVGPVAAVISAVLLQVIIFLSFKLYDDYKRHAQFESKKRIQGILYEVIALLSEVNPQSKIVPKIIYEKARMKLIDENLLFPEKETEKHLEVMSANGIIKRTENLNKGNNYPYLYSLQ